ncbi:hypothetical protein BDP81DRAFT_502655 [Colletotrichum phormii]|uniref:Ankyrin repeat protein n=1 Tax=Colletotrichum phormii TaxID=359342 RepID=A0AAI9ZFY7_9PEZI|nr:uncharacterized protein BDP81DRAFT_502655 [Colletotrichum phormii]KAK1623726.1 hypothetical protein BDP81DRAFT_502655 [Colletotrichum phormii]
MRIPWRTRCAFKIFRRACLMGHFDMAVETRPTAVLSATTRHVRKFLRPVYRGDEINLTLQAISEERFRLAVWLLTDGASANGVDASGCSALHRAVLLRHWHLASTLLEHGASAEGLVGFCSRMELAHFCVLHADLEGIAFLAKASRGVALNALSSGPVFTDFAPIHVAAFRESDWCRLYSIGTLMTEGASLRPTKAHGFATSKTIYSLSRPGVDFSSKSIFLLATTTRKFVSLYCRDLLNASDLHQGTVTLGETTVLEYFRNSLESMDSFLKHPRDSRFPMTDLILSLREITGALSHLDKKDTARGFPMVGAVSSSTLLTWQVQMRLLQIVDLILKSTVSVRSVPLPRTPKTIPVVLYADLLHTSIASKPTALDGDCMTSTSQFAQQFRHFRHILEECFDANGLPWLLQCSLILGANFQAGALVHFASSLDVTYLSSSWLLSDQDSHQTPIAVRKELRSMGCREDILDTLDEVLFNLKAQPGLEFPQRRLPMTFLESFET